MVPHPAVVNLFLRLGLPETDGIALSLRHEFDHMQTLPPALVYVGALLSMSVNLSPWARIPVVLISSQASWEMMAEFFT